jgi:hypothetical protein
VDVLTTCADLACGVPFKIPHHIEEQARRNVGRKIHCPNGHWFVYTTSEPARLQERIASLERSLASMTDSYKKADRLRIYWQGMANRRKPKGKG